MNKIKKKRLFNPFEKALQMMSLNLKGICNQIRHTLYKKLQNADVRQNQDNFPYMLYYGRYQFTKMGLLLFYWSIFII